MPLLLAASPVYSKQNGKVVKGVGRTMMSCGIAGARVKFCRMSLDGSSERRADREPEFGMCVVGPQNYVVDNLEISLGTRDDDAVGAGSERCGSAAYHGTTSIADVRQFAGCLLVNWHLTCCRRLGATGGQLQNAPINDNVPSHSPLKFSTRHLKVAQPTALKCASRLSENDPVGPGRQPHRRCNCVPIKKCTTANLVESIFQLRHAV